MNVATPTILDFVDKKSQSYYEWLDWVIMENRELDFVDKERVRKYAEIKVSMCKHCMFQITKIVEKKITAILPDRFGLMFDAWENESSNEEYIGAFALVPGHPPLLLFLQPFFIEEYPENADDIMFGSKDYKDMIVRQTKP